MDLLKANGAAEAFQAEMAGPPRSPPAYAGQPIPPRSFRVEIVRTLPGTNGLVYVQVQQEPKWMAGAEPPRGEDWPDYYWFFFDRSGRLLAWSNLIGPYWVIADVTGEGAKNLLTSRARPGTSPDVPCETYFTLFRTTDVGTDSVDFGSCVSYEACPGGSGITLIYLPECSLPLVMTYETRYPLEDAGGRHAEWAGTVLRSFKGGEPKVILVISHYAELCVDPRGTVQLRGTLQPYEDAELAATLGEKPRPYTVGYDEITRKFEFKWASEDKYWLSPVEFSAKVPQ
ncbi:MAG: hypothetical protein NTX87_10390 [Planctomycetota bacterium]|nr:hypothetical protein [Planctomycetota bacterium]